MAVDSRGSVELQFQPLDVFRWEVCEAFGAEVSKLAERHDGLPLALRLVVTGRSRADEQLAADPVGWTAQLRAAAVDAAPGRVWVEKVRFRTALPCARDTALPTDGPIGELRRYLDELRGDDAALLGLAGELGALRRKLPDELMRGDEALALDDPGALRGLLDAIQPLLLGRLMKESKT